MQLECDKCNNTWDYSGQSKYATCPECFANVTLSDFEWDVHRKEQMQKLSDKLAELRGDNPNDAETQQ